MSVLFPEHGIALFTDGSCYHKDRVGGYAYLALDAYGGEKAGMGTEDDTTISRMELQAVIAGLNDLLALVGPCDVLVYSDSEYVVLGASDRNRARNKNRDLWQLLDEAVDAHQYVEFEHVKGHGDSLYNDRVDKLAGTARKMIV